MTQNIEFFQVLIAAFIQLEYDHSYNLNMILIKIENCTLTIGVLRNKCQVPVRKSRSFVCHKIFIFPM